MAPSPGTPVGGERPRQRSHSPRPARPPPQAQQMQVDDGGGRPCRVFCPVPTCPCHDTLRHRGWATAASMQAHVDAHLAGTLQGEVPAEWLHANNRTRCLVCGLSVAANRGVHPTCRPAYRAAAGNQPADDTMGGEALPSFADIQAGRTRTLRHIPAAAKSLWTRTLSRALAAVVHSNNPRSWQELLMLPQTVLDAPPRGGHKHAKAAAAYTLDRLQRWDAGERLSLWESRRQLRVRHAGPRAAADRQDFAISLAREGFDGKACAALLAEGLAPDTPDNVAALRSLHPVQPAVPITPAQALPLGPDITPALVGRALRSFPASSAPGPSGLRVQHLRDACLPGSTDSFLDQLTTLVSFLSNGQACPAAAPFLAGANLVAAPKPKGGLRPIAIGEVLRRLTGKCLMESVQTAAREHFFPAQIGVAVPGGAEAAVHAVRAWTTQHAQASSKVLVKLDFANAFNSVSRQQVLASARSQFPSLSRWVHWCYGEASYLQFGGSVLQSAGGVQQGDPLGPLLFAAAVQPLTTQLQQSSLDLATFYLDDGILAGDVGAVASALRLVQQRSADIGLHLNLHKCEVVGLGSLSAAQLVPHFPDSLLRAADGTSRLHRNFELLGAAIGDDDFVASHTNARVDKAGALLEAIGELEDPQVALRLLRSCAGHARIVHSIRCTPPAAHPDALTAFDLKVRSCFSSFSGIHLDSAQWEQATRSFAQAGLSLRSAARDASAAYLASVGSTSGRAAGLHPVHANQSPSHQAAVQDALSSFNTLVPVPLSADTALSKTQRALTQLADKASWEQQLCNAPISTQAILRSEAEPGARAFLAAVPFGRTRMEPAAFTAEIRHRLSVPDAVEDTWCPKCDGVLDRYSHHASTCCAGGERTLRHTAVRDILCHWADRAGLQPEKEKAGLLLPQRPEEQRSAGRRPADLFVPSYLGSPTAFDLAFTAPLRQETLGAAARQALAAASAYAGTKMAHLQTAEMCRSHGVQFTPLVAETTAAWEPHSAAFLKRVARAVAAREGALAALLEAQLLQELCIAARSFHARTVLHRRAELSAATS